MTQQDVPPGKSNGFSAAVYDGAGRSLDLHEYLVHHPAATYFMRCDSSALEQEGIYNGDLLVCDRSLDVREGDYVVILCSGEYFVRRYRAAAQGAIFEAADGVTPPMCLKRGDFEFYGVVTACVRRFRG